ncbi:MAG: Y-family DNA polymerase [Bacteroidetes bacterium]|nr:Y-family DNA polymerase [Bacteroidota bacterium]
MIGLLDCNNFYVSCERLFNPAIRTKPVIVLSNNDGCAIARSEEAKQIGVKMGSPLHFITDLIKQNDIQVFSSNYTLYGDISARVMNVIRSFVERVEVYSIDEIFLDLSGHKYQDIIKLATKLRHRVQQQTGIPVSIGIAPSKTLAKMANRYAKQYRRNEGVHLADSKESIDQMLRATEVGDIWGIGNQYEKLMLQNGIKTAADLAKLSEDWIRKNMSVVGHRMAKELKGIPCIRWEEKPPPKKAICTSRSFGSLVTKKSQLSEAVASFTASCAKKLRKENTVAAKMEVFVQTNPFRHQDRQYFCSHDLQLRVPSNNTQELLSYSMRGLSKIFIDGFNYHKAGIIVTDITSAHMVQMSIFDKPQSAEQKVLMESIDQLNRNFGPDKVRYAAQGYSDRWHLKRDYLSQAYTTNAGEFLTIKI